MAQIKVSVKGVALSLRSKLQSQGGGTKFQISVLGEQSFTTNHTYKHVSIIYCKPCPF